jgi:hypothetical protein
MDVAALAAFLAPSLGFLLNTGKAATERAAEKLGDTAWEHARRLWERLRPAVEGKPAAEEAALDIAAQPDDETARAALAWQLKKLLEADPQLVADVEHLWAEAQRAGVVAAGARSVAAGGSITGSTIVTGDRNVLGGGP